MKHLVILFIVILAGCQSFSVKPSVMSNDKLSTEHGHTHWDKLPAQRYIVAIGWKCVLSFLGI